MQNPTTESSNSENHNSSAVLGMSNPTIVQCSRESDTCAGKDTQGAVDHNTVFGEVDGMKEVPNPSNNIGRLPTDHININDDEIHDVTPITVSALETVHTDPTGMGSTEHISDAISTSSQESSSKNLKLHDHEGNMHVESDCSPSSLQEGDQTSKVEIDLESTDLNQEVSSNKLLSKTSVSNDKMNCSSTAYLVDESQTPTNFDFTLNEKLEKFSLDDIDKVDVSSGNIGEDAVDFINALHNAEEGIDLELDPSMKSDL